MSFRTKTILGIALIQATLLFVLITNSLSFLRSSNEQALAQRAATAVSLVASSARDAVLSVDVATLDSLVWVTLANEGLVYARVISANMSVLAQAGDAEALSRPFVEDHSVRDVADGVFDIRAEIRESQALFGYVDLGLSVGQIDELLAVAQRQMAVTALIAITLTAVFSLILGIYLTRELKGLAQASGRIAKGDFDYRLPIRSQDELGQTAHAFNRMSARLSTLYEELKVALDAAQESRQNAIRNEERIRNLLEGTTDAYLEIDADGRCSYLNPRGEKLFNIARAQIAGKQLSEVIPDVADYVDESPQGSVGAAKAYYQERYCTANQKWLAVHTHPSADGVSMYFHDISDRIANRLALRASEARLQRAQRVAHIGNWEYDLEGSVLNLSDELYRLLGAPPGSAITYRSFMTHVHHEDRRTVHQAVRDMFRTDGPQETEFRIRRPGGEDVIARGLGEATMNDDASVASVFGVIQDISDYKRSEEKAQLALIEKVKAQTANKAKSQFLANMSHELRTPLNAVIGYSEMLEEDAEMDGHTQYAEDLRKINLAGRHLLQLVNDVLDLAKIEADRMDIYLEEFSVGSMIDEIGVTMEPLVAKNNNRLQLDCAADVEVIQADANKVRQTLMNLLSNAAKFSSDGTISLKAWSESQAGDPWIVFEVSDTGIGITPEQLERLFRPFAQADASTTRKYGGTGLGLAISKQFIEMMGGRIDVHSVVGEGTLFTVHLPAIVQDQEASGSAASHRNHPVTQE